MQDRPPRSRTIAAGIEPQVTAQLAAEDPKVRALAISVLAKIDGGKPEADAAIAKALADSGATRSGRRRCSRIAVLAAPPRAALRPSW